MSENFDPVACVQRQLDAYNARNLERFVAEFTDDTVVCRLSAAELIIQGKPPLDNWGIRGGQPASEVALGFNLKV
ncbi:MAG: hypothetical protein IPO13_09600 [Rhodocyclaceae bacterium]|nr:hypothetical protein [Rhodocyclaceae bacterium]